MLGLVKKMQGFPVCAGTSTPQHWVRVGEPDDQN